MRAKVKMGGACILFNQRNLQMTVLGQNNFTQLFFNAIALWKPALVLG